MRSSSVKQSDKSVRALCKASLLATLPLATLFLLPLTAHAAPGNIDSGKAISNFCTGCHGDVGETTNSSYPRLAGQNYAYLVSSLKKFKSGAWKSPLMQSIASGMSLAQMQAVAAYYSSLTPVACASGTKPLSK